MIMGWLMMNYMRLIDLINEVDSKITNRRNILYYFPINTINSTDKNMLGLLFEQENLSKICSPLVVNLYEKYINDYDDFIDRLADCVSSMYLNKWTKLRELYVLDYNPIENYNMVENSTLTTNKTDDIKGTTTTKGTQSNNSTLNNSVYGFNSSSDVNSDKETSSLDITNDNTDTNTEIITSSGKDTNQLTRSGNIGVTTTQQMFEAELKLREQMYYNIIFNDISNLLFLKIY